MSPLDLRGPWFLLFYVPLLLGAFLVAWRLRRRLLQPDDDGEARMRELESSAIEKGLDGADYASGTGESGDGGGGCGCGG